MEKNWISITVDGFFAHEVTSYHQVKVEGEKDAVVMLRGAMVDATTLTVSNCVWISTDGKVVQ